MIKKMRLLYLLPIIIACFFASCASTTTEMTDVWKDKDYQGKAQKIVVIMAAKSSNIRDMFENRFVAALEDRGNNAIQSYKIVAMEQLPDRELVKSKIKTTGADTVLVSRLVDTKTVESYMPGQTYNVPNSYNDWGSYYDILFTGNAYTDDIQVAYIETNLYNLKTEKLIWSAHSKTERTEGEQQLINTFINIMINKLSSAGIIQ
jgi:hypothetical protein